jgi:hypothetical protein
MNTLLLLISWVTLMHRAFADFDIYQTKNTVILVGPATFTFWRIAATSDLGCPVAFAGTSLNSVVCHGADCYGSQPNLNNIDAININFDSINPSYRWSNSSLTSTA